MKQENVCSRLRLYIYIRWCKLVSGQSSRLSSGDPCESQTSSPGCHKTGQPLQDTKTTKMNMLPWQCTHTDTSVCPLGSTHADALQHTKQCAQHNITLCTQDTQQVTDTFSNLIYNTHKGQKRKKEKKNVHKSKPNWVV